MDEQNIIIEADQIGKSYKRKEGRIDALVDLSLQVKRGEILGILGPNGAGKTTAVKLIMGFLHPTSGDIFFLGKKLKVAEPRTQIGYLPESFQPNSNLTVFEYIKFQCELAAGSGKEQIQDDAIEELLGMVSMDRFMGRRISDLSKGMGQRVGLAQAFANDPDFLILDEPTSGLDPIGRSEIIAFLLKMKKRGKTILFCSHILSEVERICDRIGILVEGRLKFLGPVQEFLEKWDVVDIEEGFKLEVQCETS